MDRSSLLAELRGPLAEARVLWAIRKLAAFRWFLRVEEPTFAQDRLGMDWFVYTREHGRIVLQVKSSRERAAEFIERGRRMRPVARIHVVVAAPHDSDAVVYGRVLGTCIKAMEEAEAAGLLADDPRLIRLEAA